MASYSGHVEHGMCRITSMRSQLPYHAYHPLLKHLYSLAQVSCPVVAESGKHFALSQKARSFSGAPQGWPRVVRQALAVSSTYSKYTSKKCNPNPLRCLSVV